MSKGKHGEKRVEKKSKSGKHSNHHHKDKHSHRKKKHLMEARGEKQSAASSSSVPEVYTEPGPHGSTSVKAIRGSPFLYARNGSYAIRDGAYVKEVLTSSGEQAVVMNCDICTGVLISPNTRQAKFTYPDGSFLHCVPVCDVRVVSMRSVFNLGRGREYIYSQSEVYGRDSVLLAMRTAIVNKLKKYASRTYNEQYEQDKIFSFGGPDEDDSNITLMPCTVRKHAKLVAELHGRVYEKELARVVGWDNKDIDGDALIAFKYVRNTDEKTAELVFELQDIMVRRGVEKLFGSSSTQH